MDTSPENCAAELLETVPLLMRIIRANVRRHGGMEMSVPQFRTLAFIGRNKGAALSDVAAHLGLTLPSTSKLVEGLVSSKLATRETHTGDRRCVVLALTPAGQKRHAAARRMARDFLAEGLASLGADQREQILHATQTLKMVFTDDEKQKVGTARTPHNAVK
jgi:DNA-binding MarR family transcriptional regulator